MTPPPMASEGPIPGQEDDAVPRHAVAPADPHVHATQLPRLPRQDPEPAEVSTGHKTPGKNRLHNAFHICARHCREEAAIGEHSMWNTGEGPSGILYLHSLSLTCVDPASAASLSTQVAISLQVTAGIHPSHHPCNMGVEGHMSPTNILSTSPLTCVEPARAASLSTHMAISRQLTEASRVSDRSDRRGTQCETSSATSHDSRM
jgi:hypothetical protein